jgi:2-polyprenyl-3-methyl-5-hydroxy-6-metoxy-1,4-benzoquinol methylase
MAVDFPGVSGRALAHAAWEGDSALAAAIDPWLEHMRWRADFAQWRERRLWQENTQTGALNHLRSFLNVAETNSNDGPIQSKSIGPAKDFLAGRSVLDLGSGMGGLSTALALAGAEVLPLDFNPAYCHITRLRGMRYGLNLAPVNAAGEALPFATAQFDIILCMDVLEHVQDPEKLVAEISRCLKPGGLCQVTAINRFAFNDPHYHLRFVNWLPRRLAPTYIRLAGRAKDNSRFADRQSLNEMHYYRFGELRKLFARHGLSNFLDSGEIKQKRRLSGWKGLLQRSGFLKIGYPAYRSLYQSTYVVMALKSQGSAEKLVARGAAAR